MLLLLFLLEALKFGIACQKIPLYYGTLDPALALPGGPITGVISSCQCCAFCNNNELCKSFSFRGSTGECTLYSKVGSYPKFLRQDWGAEDTEFYIMPRSSTTEEFCRQDEDCVSGEPCLGRVCTTNRTITCLSIKELNPTINTHTFWGAVDGTEIRLSCLMDVQGGGWTQLVDAVFNFFWQPADVLSLNSTTVDGDVPRMRMGQPYSALWAAELIRDSRPGDYKVIVRSQAPEKGVLFSAPRAQSLLGTTPVSVPYAAEPAGSGFSFAAGTVVFPYMLNQHGVVYHMNGDKSSDIGGIMRSAEVAGDRWAVDAVRPHAIQLWIKEGQ
ncbi:hypothetical protein FJT64_011223 [Amphibalanus amphitrite]|uniref:Apple domain-containing protein n=1 Tax=Amphibalanus amphitrite TaxID=1232801 RepID=A0A6A4V7M0_AMPAM|nr:hypothetical protein FJT64_011223 [Amphibalanus amphitrite]